MLRSHIGVKKPGELLKDRLDRKARRSSDGVCHSINIGSPEERKHMVFIPSVRRLEDMETPEALPPPPSATSQPPLPRPVIANGSTRASPSRPAPRRKAATDGMVDSHLAAPGAVVKSLVNSVPATAAVNRRNLGPMNGKKEGPLRGESADETQDAIDAVQLSLARLRALRNVLCRANLMEGEAPIGEVEDSHDASLREASLRPLSSRETSLRGDSLREGREKVESGDLAASLVHTHKGIMAPCQRKGRLEDSGVEKLGGTSLEKACQHTPTDLEKGRGRSEACGRDTQRSKQEGRAGVAAIGQGGSIDAQLSARDMDAPSQEGRHEEILRQARMEALKRILARQQEGAAVEEGEGRGWRRDKEEVETRSVQERGGERRRDDEAASEEERQKESILQQVRVEALRRVLGGRVPLTEQSEKCANRAVTSSTSTFLDKGGGRASLSSTAALHSPALAMAHTAPAKAIVQKEPPLPHSLAPSFTQPPQAPSFPLSSSSSTTSISSRLAVREATCPTATLPQDPPLSIKAPSRGSSPVTSSSTTGGLLQTLEIGPMPRQSSPSVGPSVGPSCPPPSSLSGRRGQCAAASATNEGERAGHRMEHDRASSPLSTQAAGTAAAMCGDEKGLLVGASSEPCGEAESGPLSPASVGCGKEGEEGARTRLGLKRRRQCTSLPSDQSTDLVQPDRVVDLGDDAHFYSCAKGKGEGNEGKGRDGPTEGAQEQQARDTGDASGRGRGGENVPTGRAEGKAGEGHSGNKGGRKEEGKGGKGPSAEAVRPAGAKQRHRRLRKREIQCLTVRSGRSGARLQHVMVYGRYDAALFDRFAPTPNRNRYLRLATSPADGPTPPPAKVTAAAAGRKTGTTALKTIERSSAVAAPTTKPAASRPPACKTGVRKAAAAEEGQAAGVAGDKGQRGAAIVKAVPLSNGSACNIPACLDRNEAKGACSPLKACARRDQSFRRFLEQRASADRR